MSSPTSTSEDRYLQELGSVKTIQGRCAAFPNVCHHQVEPFRLEDPTQRGVRKIFVAFLVYLTYTIPSATTAASQQREMIQKAMLAADNSSWLGQLPAEPINIISSGNGGTMSGGEAEAYSLEFMDERAAFVEESDLNYFGRVFNVWYALVSLYSLLEGITKVLNISEQ